MSNEVNAPFAPTESASAPSESGEPMPRANLTLLDLRGSVPVDGEQDFEAIRRRVIGERARRQTGRQIQTGRP